MVSKAEGDGEYCLVFGLGSLASLLFPFQLECQIQVNMCQNPHNNYNKTVQQLARCVNQMSDWISLNV